jgi:hypothetical protein
MDGRANLGTALGGLIALVIVSALPAFAQSPAPPADLTKLERQVSLKIAHVRMEGPTNAADFKRLGEAQSAQFDGEKALKAGDYKRAEEDFVRANAIITPLVE